MTTSFVPVRRITNGPLYHWFGYYDKQQVSDDGRYALSNQVDFEGRSPRADDVIQVGMIDLQDGDRWIELGSSRAWCWQQGCMLQWRPGHPTQVIWNDRQDDGPWGARFVSHIVDIVTGERRTVPFPIYSLSPDGCYAVYPDFRRINDTRPGYGYAGIPDPNARVLYPDGTGIWRGDLETGESELVVSLAAAAAAPYPHEDLSTRKQWFNHLLYSPSGQRFEFLHRWNVPGATFATRMMTVGVDGGDLRVVDGWGDTSHFIWRDADHILAWATHPSHGYAFYLYPDEADPTPEVVGLEKMPVNGHCTYLPGNEYILNDAYPNAEREQVLYLYRPADDVRIELGSFYEPPEYTGEWRCDLHPRSTPDGRYVLIDSTHEGLGRQQYLVEIGDIVDID